MDAGHRGRLRVWLRGHGLHPRDIATALAWYDLEYSRGKRPTDRDILLKGEESHEKAVGTAIEGIRAFTPPPLKPILIASAIGGGLGACLASVLMRLLL